jgi:hypothetical protein
MRIEELGAVGGLNDLCHISQMIISNQDVNTETLMYNISHSPNKELSYKRNT